MIQITSEGAVIATATLDEHASARDFAALLLHAVHRRLELLRALGQPGDRPDGIQVRIERLLRQ